MRGLKTVVGAICLSAGAVVAADLGFDAEKGLAEARRAQFRPKTDRVLPVAVVQQSKAGVRDAAKILKPDGQAAVLSSDGKEKPWVMLDMGEASLSGYAVVHVKSAKGATAPVLRLAYACFDQRMSERGEYDERTRAAYMSRDVELPVLPANINRYELYTVARTGAFLAPMHQPQFRYVRVQLDTPGEVEIDGIEWIIGDFYDRQDLAGYFNSSDPDLNRHWQIGVWTSQIATIRDVDAWRTLDGWLLPRKLERSPDCGFAKKVRLPASGSVSTVFELRDNPIREDAVGFALFAKGPEEGLFFSLDETGLVRWIRRWKGRDDILREQRLEGVKLTACRPYALEIRWKPTDDNLFASQSVNVELALDGKPLTTFTYYHSGLGGKFGFWTPKGFWPLFDSVELKDGTGKSLLKDDFGDAKLAKWDFTRAEPFVADGATRDRLIWSGDLWWAGRNLYYSLADQYGMRESLKLLARMTTPEGYVHACPYAESPAPKSGDLGMFESDEFAAWFVPVLHDYWLYTADRKTLDAVWPSLEKLMGYLAAATDEKGIFQPRLEASKHATASYLQNGDVAHRCFMDILLYWCRKDAAEMAAARGDTALAEKWASEAEATKKAVFANYWNGHKTHFYAQRPWESRTYHWDNKALKMVQKDKPADITMANAIALATHIVDGERAQGVAKVVNDYKGVIKFVVMGARGKAEYGMGNEAWTMIVTNNWSQMTKPAWHAPACTPEGMPVLGECWECGDYSHPDVALAGFISTAFLGIVPVEAGFRTFKFEPNPYDKLQWAEGRVPTPFGPIDARWERTGGGLRYIFTVPKGTTCLIKDVPYGPGTYDLSPREVAVRTFEHNEFGRRPDMTLKASRFEAIEPDKVMMDGKAVRKRVRITSVGPYGTNAFAVTAFVPVNRKPAPAFLLVCNRPPHKNIDPDRKEKSEFWPAEEIVDRGYAAVAFYNGEVALDGTNGLATGAIACFTKPGTARQPDDWGVISAWAWGASRTMDWLETVPEIDAKKVAVVGHSRGGKTALWTGATDTRFAMAVSNGSGCGGAKLNRMRAPGAETIAALTKNFGYWFCPNYLKYAKRDWDLPFDQDELLGAVAPRLVAIGSGEADEWAGPAAEKAAAERARRFWKDSTSVDYHVRPGGHNLTLVDWQAYMDFAARKGW